MTHTRHTHDTQTRHIHTTHIHDTRHKHDTHMIHTWHTNVYTHTWHSHMTHTHDTHTTHTPHTLRHMNSLEVNNFVCFLFPALIVLGIMEGYWWGFFLFWLRWLFGMKMRWNLICGDVQCENSVCGFYKYIFVLWECLCLSFRSLFCCGYFFVFLFLLWLVIHKNLRKICMDQHTSAQIS